VPEQCFEEEGFFCEAETNFRLTENKNLTTVFFIWLTNYFFCYPNKISGKQKIKTCHPFFFFGYPIIFSGYPEKKSCQPGKKTGYPTYNSR
jgi:hypothetical protein